MVKRGFQVHPENIRAGPHEPETIEKMKKTHRAKYPPYFRIREHPATSNMLRRRYLDTEIEELCVNCDLGKEWNGEPLTLQLDHINGIRFDDRLENLRWLCPNCHTQTPTYGWRNRKRKKKVRIQ